MTDVEKSNSSLYQLILGSDWERLSWSVQRAHKMILCRGTGDFDIALSSRVFGRFVAWCLGLPASGIAVPTKLHVARMHESEVWTRTFGARRLRSTQHSPGLRHLVERFGLLEIWFHLEIDRGGIRYEQQRTCLRVVGHGVSIPQWLSPRVSALELPGGDNQTSVCVAVHLPIVGLLARYEGTMEHWEGSL